MFCYQSFFNMTTILEHCKAESTEYRILRNNWSHKRFVWSNLEQCFICDFRKALTLKHLINQELSVATQTQVINPKSNQKVYYNIKIVTKKYYGQQTKA